jgi:peptidyl-prolyl cis-trans isomerase C
VNRFSLLWLPLMVALLAITTRPSAAPEADETARRSRIAIKVGGRTASVGEVEDRLAEIPSFQLTTYGGARNEIVKAFVDQVVVRELVLGAGAEERKLDMALPTKHQLLRAKSTATLRAVRSPFKSPSAIPLEDVTRYYDENRSRFDSPERVNLWRILCKTREEADTVLAAAKRELTIPKWNDLAREHSMDKATNFRGGNLGFVGPDGTSNEAGLKVDLGLLKGASAVKDGDVVPHAVPEGTAFAVIWRRSTVPATRRSVEDATAQIRTTLFRERTEAAEKKLIDDLRAKHVRDVNVDLLKIIEIPPFDAGISLPRSTPGSRPEAGSGR